MRKVPVCSVEEAMLKMAEKNGIRYEPGGNGDSLTIDDNGVLIKAELKEDGTVAASREKENAIVFQVKKYPLPTRENNPLTGDKGDMRFRREPRMKEISEG